MTLNLTKISTTYFNQLFQGPPKVLLVDQHTTPIISLSYTQSQLLSHEVILIETIENQTTLNPMKHLDCVIFIKPTRESIQHLLSELSNPHYGRYRLFLNNIIHKAQLEKIAETDEFEVIQSVIEIFNDYSIINDNLFGICRGPDIIDEAASLVSLLLSLKKCPIIKYEAKTKRLASEVLYSINMNSNNNLFDLSVSDTPPLLVILDRSSDPVTPLMTPWTYQSMIHEFIGIEQNMAQLGNEKVVLSDAHDKFFRESMYMNYGDLTENFQRHVEKYKAATKQSSLDNLRDLAELKKVLTRFPEYKKLSNNILKHLNLISELDSQISRHDLWVTGELEQLIVCNLDSPVNLHAKLVDVVNNQKVPLKNKLRLILLYRLMFPTREVPKLADATPSQNALISRFPKLFPNVRVAQQKAPEMGLFNKNKINSLFNLGQESNDNVYMQYTPRLHSLLGSLVGGQDGLAEFVPEAVKKSGGVQDVIVYIRGGGDV